MGKLLTNLGYFRFLELLVQLVLSANVGGWKTRVEKVFQSSRVAESSSPSVSVRSIVTVTVVTITAVRTLSRIWVPRVVTTPCKRLANAEECDKQSDQKFVHFIL